MFGVSGGTWTAWVREGRVTCGQRLQRPGDGHTCVLYPKAALERLRDQIEQIGKPYPDPQRPGVWRVPLNGYGEKREALIDEADLPIVQGVSRCWRARAVMYGGGGEVILHVNRKQRPLQRLIMEAIAGVIDPSLRIGFTNGDPLDCRRMNLVLRTQAQVAYAARPPKMRQGKARTSTFKGVGFDRKCRQWRASITRGKLKTTIGTFDDPITAAEAFDDCARLWYGEHAYLNFPDRALSDDRRSWAQGVLDRANRQQRRRERRVKRLGRLLRREAQATSVPTQSPIDAPAQGPKSADVLHASCSACRGRRGAGGKSEAGSPAGWMRKDARSIWSRLSSA